MKLYLEDIIPYIGDMFRGLGLSITLTILSMLLGLLLGVLAYLGKTGSNRVFKRIAKIYIEAIRNTPLLVQLYILYFGLTQFGIDFSPFMASLIAMIINAGAYNAEIMRAGFASVPSGTIEAGAALGMSKFQIFIYVTFLPALKNAFPALINQFILLFLFSSVTATISMPELTYVTMNLQSSTARVFEVLLISGILYYSSTVISVFILRRCENKLFQW